MATAPAFRDAFKSRRCIIPASGFYEWKKTAATKQPYAIVPTDGPVFAFAGFWSNWRDKAAGERNLRVLVNRRSFPLALRTPASG